ncbi:helix-turn-helix domain-containing protein [Brevibacillus sp. NRS-1366]|uniref:helix-turn-helix domain-containing protein n=1 Tax=Brevibacillus sp. NRS-1366 TaxID=3233899 RepID=UPI003D1B480B
MTYPFRLYPTPDQEQKLMWTLEMCRGLYNIAKEQRELAYKQQGISVYYSKQQRELPQLKQEFPEYKAIHSQVLQNYLQRLDELVASISEKFYLKESQEGPPRKYTS